MAEVMTLAMVYEKFESQWVLLEDPELNENREIVKGRVLFHSKNRDEVDHEMLALRPRHGATVYTGSIPSDAAVVL